MVGHLRPFSHMGACQKLENSPYLFPEVSSNKRVCAEYPSARRMHRTKQSLLLCWLYWVNTYELHRTELTLG